MPAKLASSVPSDNCSRLLNQQYRESGGHLKPQTLTEKLLARAVKCDQVEPGEIVVLEPDVVLSHDNSAAIATLFRQLPQKRVKYPDRLAITLDHAVPPPTPRHAQNHASIREFVGEQGIVNFFEIGRGICHQVLCEEGLIGPGLTLLGCRQPQHALWLAGRVQRRHWAKRSRGALGDWAIVAARPADDARHPHWQAGERGQHQGPDD